MLKRTTALVLMVSCNACVSSVDIPPPARGSATNPVHCDSAEGQVRFLRRHYLQDGSNARFAFQESVPGQNERMLDRFRLQNPEPDERSMLTQFFDLFRFEPEYPPAYGVYMDLHSERCETELLPGYRAGGSRASGSSD